MNRLVEAFIPDFVSKKIKLALLKKHLKSSRAARDAVGKIGPGWRERIEDVMRCPDNASIPRVSNAGELHGYWVTMHNGVKVCANSYYGAGILNMLIENRGVHEPQEELAFEAIIKQQPDDCTMLELGAYWAYYSLSLLQERPRAKCFLVEPDENNLVSGLLNFRLNRRDGVFVNAFVDEACAASPATISVDAFCHEHKIQHLHILHADIQGFELQMLKGAQQMLSEQRVDFIFISTHSNPLHAECIATLESGGYKILADADLNDSYSFDGLVVAKRISLDLEVPIAISRKSEDQTS